jgi:thymidylate kinase
LHVITQKPFLVTLSGCDGSGKTVQARALEDVFKTCDMRVAVVWSRGASSPASGALIRLGKRLFGGDDAADPAPGATEADKLAGRRRRLESAMARRLFSVVYASELFWTWVVKVRWLLLRGHAVVCDRYVADAMVDFAVLSGTDVTSPPAALRFLRALAPRPHVAFLLDVIEGEALARKPEEGSVDHLAEARRAFKSLAAVAGMIVLPAHMSQEQVYETVAHETLAPFYLRYRTFINWLYLSNPGQMNPGAWRAKTVYHQDGVSAP